MEAAVLSDSVTTSATVLDAPVHAEGNGGLDFETFLHDLDEPEGMLAARRRSWARYLELPFPTRRTEEWRYTDLSKIGFDSLEAVSPARAGLEEDLPESVREVLARSGDRAGIVVQRNGRVVHLELDPDVAAQGVILRTLDEAARRDPDLIARLTFGSEPAPMEEKLWHLGLALLSGGYLLHVPRGIRIEAPIHVFRLVDRTGVLTATHSLVVAEPGSESGVIDEFVSDDLESVSLHSAVVHAADNARVEYVGLQRYGAGMKHFSIQHLSAQRDARIETFNVQLGADLARADVTSRLLGPGCDSQMLALWLADHEQHYDHHTLQHHIAPNAHSDLLFKGALLGKATSVFRGLIRVDRGAQLTDAYQTNRNLLLSEDAHAVSLPSLEIEADDVRCSHGATIGQVEPEQLFYLMSRGLTRNQAERLLVRGFFDEVLQRLPMASVRGRVLEAIEGKIGL